MRSPTAVEKENPMDKRLLDLLVCPLCKGKLRYNQAAQELTCPVDRLAFPIRDQIPSMLVEDARELPPEEEVEGV